MLHHAAEHAADATLGAAEFGVHVAICTRIHPRWFSACVGTAAMLFAGLALWKGNWYLNWYVDAHVCAHLYYVGLGLVWIAIPLGLVPALIEELRVLSRRGEAQTRLGRLYRAYEERANACRERAEALVCAPASQLWARGSRRLRRHRSDLGARWRVAPEDDKAGAARNEWAAQVIQRNARARLVQKNSFSRVVRQRTRIRNIRTRAVRRTATTETCERLARRVRRIVASVAVVVIVAGTLGVCTLWAHAWHDHMWCERASDALASRIRAEVKAAGEADGDGARHALLASLRASLDDAACARRELDRLLPTTHAWAYYRQREGETPRVEPDVVDLTSLTGGENGYLAGWWSTRVVPYVPSFPPPQLETSHVHALWCLYRGRMLAQNAIEYGADPGEALALLDVARAAFPANALLKSYFGHTSPWGLGRFDGREWRDANASSAAGAAVAAAARAAPAWARDVRFALEHLDAVVLFWHVQRQSPEDGSLGGGWGDDVELWRQWTPLLFGFSYANYSSLWQRVAAGVYELPEMERGFTDHLSDVEHTAEMSGDTAWPISVMLDNANFTCNGTSLLERSETRAACAAHDIALLQKRSGQKGWRVRLRPEWTKQQRLATEAGGVLLNSTVPKYIDQIRSSWVSSTAWWDFEPFACSVAYHVRAAQPALGRWRALARQTTERGPDWEILNDALRPWLDGWVVASRGCGEKGRKDRPQPKPCGVLPNALHISDAPLPLEKGVCFPVYHEKPDCWPFGVVNLPGFLLVIVGFVILLVYNWRRTWRCCVNRSADEIAALRAIIREEREEEERRRLGEDAENRDELGERDRASARRPRVVRVLLKRMKWDPQIRAVGIHEVAVARRLAHKAHVHVRASVRRRADVFQLFAHAVADATPEKYRGAARALLSARCVACVLFLVGAVLVLEHHANGWRPGTRTDFGGYNKEWWKPGCHILPGTFDYPRQIGPLLDALTIGFLATGATNYLEPLESMSALVLARDDLDAATRAKKDAVVGSAIWAAGVAKGQVSKSALKAVVLGLDKTLLPRTFDLVARTHAGGGGGGGGPNATVDQSRYRLGCGDEASFEATGTAALVASFMYDWRFFTEEVRFTDRIFTFHDVWFPLLRAHLEAPRRAEVPRSARRLVRAGRAVDGGGAFSTFTPKLLYAIVTGDVGSPANLVAQAVRWGTRAVDFAALVTPLGAGRDCVVNASAPDAPDYTRRFFHAKLYHFGAEDRPMSATLLELRKGTYAWRLVNGSFADRVTGELADGARVLGSGSFAVKEERSPRTVALRLPPQELVEFGVFADDGA